MSGKRTYTVRAGVEEEIKACLMARDWFEGHPEDALTEIEHRLRKVLEHSPNRNPTGAKIAASMRSTWKARRESNERVINELRAARKVVEAVRAIRARHKYYGLLTDPLVVESIAKSMAALAEYEESLGQEWTPGATP